MELGLYALGAVILFFAAPYYTIFVGVGSLLCAAYFFPNSSPSVVLGGFELVGFVWVGFKLHMWLGDKRREKEEERRRQQELRKEEEKRERQERLRCKITENAQRQFGQAVMSGRFPSEQVLAILADCDHDMPTDSKEAFEEMMYGCCTLRSLTFSKAVRLIQQRQRIEERARKRGTRREQPTAEPSGPVTEAEAYGLLGVSPGCTPEELTRAYRKKVSEWHPDKLDTMAQELKALATRQMARINEAYERLRSSRV
jgi:DnaJ domain